jgi:hypothetical protein
MGPPMRLKWSRLDGFHQLLKAIGKGILRDMVRWISSKYPNII